MRFKRKVHAQFFGSQNLEALQERVVANVDVFVGGLDSGRNGGGDVAHEWSKPVDLARVTNWLTLDIITELVFGENPGLLTDARNRWFAKAVETMSWRGVLVRLIFFFSVTTTAGSAMSVLLTTKV
jgi:hypothetical protein